MITADTTPVALAALADFSTFPATADGSLALDLTARKIYGAAVVVEWVARSWFTPRGSLAWATGLGEDVRELENVTLDGPTVHSWRGRLIAQARKRPFVQDCLVALSWANRVTTINARLVLVDGKAYPLMVSLLAASKVILTLPG